MNYEFNQVRVGDLTLAYVEQGDGAPVVLVHGAGPTDLRTWGAQIEPFGEHWHVIAYSQRYHYPNDRTGDVSDVNSTLVQSADLAALVTALQLGRAHLIGTSFGADIILRLAVDRPELVRTLVIGEPALYSWLVTLPGGPERFAELADPMIPVKKAVQDGDMDRGLRLFVQALTGEDMLDQLPPSLHQRLLDNAHLLTMEPTDIGEMVTDITREEASGIQAPTLVLTGDKSLEAFLLTSRELARYLPNVEQAEISEASHLLHVMNPEAYNTAVLSFLARHAG